MSRLLKISAAADELQVSRSRLYEMLQAGDLIAVRIGERGQRIPREEIDRFVAERMTAKPAA